VNRYVLLLLLLASASFAQVRVPIRGDTEVYSVTGTVEGKQALAFVLLKRKGATKLRLSARVAIGDRHELWNEAIKASEPRFVLRNPANVVDRLLGRSVMTTDCVLVRADGQRLELEVREGALVLGTLAGDRLDRPGPDPRDWRNNLLLRGPVARWGIARAFWDLFKPGSRRTVEFRGDSDAALSAKIGARLDLGQELTVAELFRAARAETASDEAALQASLGFLFDTPNLRYRPFPGIPLSEKREDKYQHFFVSALLAYRSNIEGSLAVGWAKEVLDMRPGGSGYNDQDLFADLLGAQFGHALRFGEVRDY